MTNLTEAFNQWANRPADERFETLQSALAFTEHQKATSQEKHFASIAALEAKVSHDAPVLVGPEGQEAIFTNYSFGQLATRIGAPAGYLRRLSPDLVVQCLNQGIKADRNKDINVLLQRNGILSAKAITSDKYARIWNSELFNRLLPLEQSGAWRVAPARPAFQNQPGTRKATEQDVIKTTYSQGLGIKVGDDIAPAGIYASDRDMFVFMIDDNKTIQAGHDVPLAKGFFLQNSEVGDCSLKLTAFLYDAVCGNHIVWNVAEINELKLVHKGNIAYRFQAEITKTLSAYSDSSGNVIEAKIEKARTMRLGDNKQEVLDMLFSKKILGMSTLESCYTAAVKDAELFHHNNDPLTAWGFAQGITLHSQSLPYANERVALDKAATKVLDIAF